MCTQKGPIRFFPTIHFVFCCDGHFEGGGGSGGGGGGDAPSSCGGLPLSCGGGGGRVYRTGHYRGPLQRALQRARGRCITRAPRTQSPPPVRATGSGGGRPAFSPGSAAAPAEASATESPPTSPPQPLVRSLGVACLGGYRRDPGAQRGGSLNALPPPTHTCTLWSRDASEVKGPERRLQKQSGRRLEEVAKAVGEVTVGYKCH